MRSIIVLTFLLAVSAYAFGQDKNSNQSVETILRKRTQEFLVARQARKSTLLPSFYDPEAVKEMHETLKFHFGSLKKDMEKGVFPRDYVKHSVEESSYGDAYKKAVLSFLFNNADFDRALASAFPRYLIEYTYTITKFQIDKVTLSSDGKTVEAHCIEYRRQAGQKQDNAITCVYRWQQKNNNWYLTLDRPPHV
ncbi:MAG: hypothetical protein AB1489_16890 [Acidobacteriota bacterium]